MRAEDGAPGLKAEGGGLGMDRVSASVGSVGLREFDGVLSDSLALGYADFDVRAIVDAAVEPGHGGFLF